MACDCGEWYAVHDHQGPPTLRVQGRCKAADVVTVVTLRVHEPPPINRDDLVLDLVYTPPSIGLPMINHVPVLFELETVDEYKTVSIVDCDMGIPVEDVH
jgi:hypothetical protein